MAGVECKHTGTIYSLCWVFQIRIGMKVSGKVTRYAGYYAGFDEISMAPGKIAMLPSSEEKEVGKTSVLADKVTEKQALKSAWEANETAIIRKFRQLNATPKIEGYVAERLYKPLYVFEFTSPDGKQKKYKALDSLTGDLVDMNL
ncbi:MAG: hypothetical protein KBS66_05720, partial [Eubacterium sp.]|nr:hypothetical protein [Candidatus Colimonas fimequi]